jgi:hypothetical protein
MGWIPGWESIQATGWWSGFFFWASIVSLIGLGITEVASHRYSERRDELVETQQQAEKRHHDDEMAQVHLETSQTNERAAKLEKDAEIARKETAQAKLELQQMRFPRRLDSDKLKAGIEGIPPQFFEVLYDQSAADGSSLAFSIFVALKIARWTTDQKLPAPLTPQQGPPDLRDVYQLLPLTEQAGASAWGVSVVTKGPISEDPKAPERILGMTLLMAVSSPVQTVGGGKDETMPAGKIRIIVGPKLP